MMSLRMAWRNVWRNPRRSAVVVTAVAVGIGGALIAMSFNYGMIVQMVDTAIGTELGHIQIHARGYDANPELRVRMRDGGERSGQILGLNRGVLAFSRRVRGEGLVTSAQASVGVRVVGVEPESESNISIVSSSITAGSYLDGTKRRVIIGERLAQRLHVEVGDKIVLSVTDMAGDITGAGVRVGGIFHTPSAVLDSGTLFLPLAESQALLGLGDAISEIVIVGKNSSSVDRLHDSLVASLDELEVRSWKQLQPGLDNMVTIFDQMGLFIYGAVFVAMLFGIANVLLMTIYERVREIGILMAIGMPRSRLAMSIVFESLIVTLVGLAIGFAIALVFFLLLRDGIELSSFAAGLEEFGIGQRIRPVLRSSDFGFPTLVAFLTAAIASAWPAYRATRFRPAEAVRHV
ncbi:MAG: FtsX-like permease family protein [Myxococcota bacterium]